MSRCPQPVFEAQILLPGRRDPASSHGPSRRLRSGQDARKSAFGRLRRFVDAVAAGNNTRGKFAGPVRIKFVGGRPVTEFRLLRKTVDYIRAKKLDFEISLATDGALPPPSMLDYLACNDVDIRIGLDGLEGMNDRRGRSAPVRLKSGSKTETSGLKKESPAEKHLNLCDILPTLPPRTIDALPNIVEFFFSPRSPAKGHYWGVIDKAAPDDPAGGLASGSGSGSASLEKARYYTRLFKTYDRLRAVPGFGDFAHSPKYRGDKEIRRLRVILRKDPELAELRAGIDCFLYSPGNMKKLVLDAADPRALSRGTHAAMEGIILYALLKAGFLNKKLRLTVGTGASTLDAGLRRYLNEHSIRRGVGGARLGSDIS